eukprot:Skav213427  [mRNA]  locus=scaffold632:3232:14162:- [translate_table: standard]
MLEYPADNYGRFRCWKCLQANSTFELPSWCKHGAGLAAGSVPVHAGSGFFSKQRSWPAPIATPDARGAGDSWFSITTA